MTTSGSRSTSSPPSSASASQMEKQRRLLQSLTELKRRTDRNRLASYAPYPKQREFHDVGARYRERLLSAANQVGKTLAGAAEVAMHLTGRYPDWWTGRRFDGPT